MIIGLDIDDVLYNTSLMVRKIAPNLLRDMGLNDTLDETKYRISEKCHLTEEQFASISNKFEWAAHAYVNINAAHMLKKLKQTNPDVDYCIVTWRTKENALPVIQLLRDYFYLDIKQHYFLPDGTNKATFCDENGISILLDDYETVIRTFTPDVKAKGVLVSTKYVEHNRAFARECELVLRDWEDLYDIITAIVKEKENGHN